MVVEQALKVRRWRPQRKRKHINEIKIHEKVIKVSKCIFHLVLFFKIYFHFHNRRRQFMILDLLRKTFLQLPIKMTMSFRLEYTITLNAVFFLHKRGCTQLNKYILLVSPPYRRRTNTQNLTHPQLLVLRYLKGTMQLLHLLHPVSNLKGRVLILADMAASGVGDNLSETTRSLYICSSLFEKVRSITS